MPEPLFLVDITKKKLVSYTSKDSDLFSSEFHFSWNRLKRNEQVRAVLVFFPFYDVIIFQISQFIY